MSAAIQPGDFVNVTIRGVRVDDQNPDGGVTIVTQYTTDGRSAFWPMPPQAAVERIAPALWPPCQGDLWRDGRQRLWLAVEGTDEKLVMVCADGGATRQPDELLMTGSVQLVHSEPDRPPF